MTRRNFAMVASVLQAALAAGCPSEKAPAAGAEPSTREAPGCAAIEELAGLDQRAPVPLQPMMAWHQKQNMMDHLVVMQRIAEGLAQQDWEAISAAAARIESSPQMQQMCQHMGAGAPGFTEMALDFHRRADDIGKAARAHDSTAVLRATSNTMMACTGCHAAYRQQVVVASEWQRRTGQRHEPAEHAQH